MQSLMTASIRSRVSMPAAATCPQNWRDVAAETCRLNAICPLAVSSNWRVVKLPPPWLTRNSARAVCPHEPPLAFLSL